MVELKRTVWSDGIITINAGVYSQAKKQSNEFSSSPINGNRIICATGILDTSGSVIKAKEDKEYNLGWLADVNTSLPSLKGDLLVPGAKDRTSQPKEHRTVWSDGIITINAGVYSQAKKQSNEKFAYEKNENFPEI
ncbi:hypothetical protein Pmar_PMAR015182 [Perkinsus marinus ATCC 50983]|uniref:Uncharacterized protein n=1 Tax=Perkinsus marinus (strain ATCC 50983 / TXsc) TaxID=423536 RepID=C5K5N5_PERM5|nr:hypothetical protein Pmar_PMAR015182 [Perkinsus marinus ATCC 50983]EER20192.1 hypothetical protein Pmar_PMAR015182 [Perkinsus marinus ATCC 50983]|eukprot:XP_002788396.1 hypothetical protein Pmar_PMAR015182 [Perkinsus marinus ATCC 50983]